MTNHYDLAITAQMLGAQTSWSSAVNQISWTRNRKRETRNRFCVIAFLTLELRIEGAHSLKEKRQVVRSLKDRLRAQFNVSVAELEATDLWQRATIGVVSISGSLDYLRGLMENVERAAARIANNSGAELVDTFTEYFREIPEEQRASEDF
jgi:uncharacterized protein YlxP (DUF503 family)